MDNKKLGVLLILIGFAVGLLFLYLTSNLSTQSRELGCFPNKDCMGIERALSFSHVAVGVFSFIFALGIYLLVFNKTDKVDRSILKKLEEENKEKIENMKFDIIMKALDQFEQRVVKAVREQEGITQSTLRLRLDMSKAKLSYVLQELEKRGLIKRVKKGKTLSIYLKI
ncbi:MarR family transcriptional regulator [Candidatus Pacearchaeota archaeon]|nr:MarR family transcriptional regulator [Candidatus Pacearchaeota archaeon]